MSCFLVLLLLAGGGSIVVDSLFIVAPTVCGGFVFAVLSVLSSFAIILLRMRELVAILCVLVVMWLFSSRFRRGFT